MTYAQQVEELQRYRKLADSLTDLCEELEELRSMATSCTAGWDFGMGTGGGAADGGRLARSVEKLTQKEEEIRAGQEQAVALREQLEEQIDSLENIRHRRVMRLIYLGGLNQGQAADKLGYCRRLVNDVHRTAVKELMEKTAGQGNAKQQKKPVA